MFGFKALEHGLGGIILKTEDVKAVLDLKVINHHLIKHSHHLLYFVKLFLFLFRITLTKGAKKVIR